MGVVGNGLKTVGETGAETEVSNTVGESAVKPRGIQPESVYVFQFCCGIDGFELAGFGCPFSVGRILSEGLKISVEALDCQGELEFVPKSGFGREIAAHRVAEFPTGFFDVPAGDDQH